MPEETVVLENDISELEKLRKVLDGFGAKNNLSQNTVIEINLVLEEAVVNIIYYAYENKKERHKIVIGLELANEVVVLRVEDDGVPFNLLHSPEPQFDTTVKKMKIGGLGIHLIRKLADSVSYRRTGGKNILTVQMRKQ